MSLKYTILWYEIQVAHSSCWFNRHRRLAFCTFQRDGELQQGRRWMSARFFLFIFLLQWLRWKAVCRLVCVFVVLLVAPIWRKLSGTVHFERAATIKYCLCAVLICLSSSQELLPPVRERIFGFFLKEFFGYKIDWEIKEDTFKEAATRTSVLGPAISSLMFLFYTFRSLAHPFRITKSQIFW